MSWKRFNKANLRGNALYKNLLSIQQELIMHREYVMYKFIVLLMNYIPINNC